MQRKHLFSSLQIVSGLGSLFVLSGCVISFNMLANRYESPETRGGRLKADVQLVAKGAHEVTLTPNSSTTVVNSNAPILTRSNFNIGGMGAMSLGESIDIGLEITNQSPAAFRAKYQILGDPGSSAKAGNFSLAVTLALGYQKWNEDAPNRNDLAGTLFDGALISGYRLADEALLYGGFFTTKTSYKGSQDLGSSSIVVNHFSGDAKQSGLNVGVMLGSSLYVKAEAALVKITAGDSSKSSAFGGVAVGAQF